MMNEVEIRKVEGEKFTVRLDGDGRPIEKAVPEMTADEVVAAWRWLFEEAMRLERKTAPESTQREEITERLERGEALSDAESAYIDARDKALRLCDLVWAAMSLDRDSTRRMALEDAVRRWWPG